MKLRCRSGGFTLPELITVLILAGILGAIAIPKLASRTTFDAMGYADQVREGIRLARREAVAQRRTVCVVAASSGLTLRQAGAAGAACDRAFVDPASGTDFNRPVPAGVSLSAAAFSFDALGRASTAAALTVSGDGLTRNVAVEAETGYVH